MERYETEFKIRQAYSLESYTYKFNNRLNKLFVFLQLFFSSFVFASVSGSSIYGGIVVIVTILAFITDPAVKATEASNQAKMLSNLIDTMSTIDDETLIKNYRTIIDTGSDILGVFKHPAYNCACLMQGTTDGETLYKLTKYEKVISWLCGNLPRA